MSNDTVSQEYLEISPHILGVFPRFRPPVSLFVFDEQSCTLKVYAQNGTRLTKGQTEDVAQFCKNGQLFVSRSEYGELATFLCKNLGLLLTDIDLKPHEAAFVFHKAFIARSEEFFDQPLPNLLENIDRDISIFCEYIWADSDRVYSFKHSLQKDHSLAVHSANCCLMAALMFVASNDAKAIREELKGFLIAALVHDLGMTNVPDFVLTPPRKLIMSERTRVEQHPAIGLKMINRLKGLSQEIILAVSEHHERYAGRGYPRGIKGEDISAIGRRIAIVDSFCAMVTDRVYAPAMHPKEALLKLLDDPGYDPVLVRQFAHSFMKDHEG